MRVLTLICYSFIARMLMSSCLKGVLSWLKPHVNLKKHCRIFLTFEILRTFNATFETFTKHKTRSICTMYNENKISPRLLEVNQTTPTYGLLINIYCVKQISLNTCQYVPSTYRINA